MLSPSSGSTQIYRQHLSRSLHCVKAECRPVWSSNTEGRDLNKHFCEMLDFYVLWGLLQGKGTLEVPSFR